MPANLQYDEPIVGEDSESTVLQYHLQTLMALLATMHVERLVAGPNIEGFTSLNLLN